MVGGFQHEPRLVRERVLAYPTLCGLAGSPLSWPEGARLCDTTQMTPELVAAHLAQLRAHGVVLLRGVFPKEPLATLRRAAQRCFRTIEAGSQPLPERYGFNHFSGSVLVSALEDFGCALTPLAVAGLDDLLTRAMGCALAGKREQSWIRKKYAPSRAPAGHYPNSWHQDGGLGVHF